MMMPLMPVAASSVYTPATKTRPTLIIFWPSRNMNRLPMCGVINRVPQAGAVGEWPEGLYEAELQVAAFQNGYYTALCNRVGEEECLTFGGESFVCAPDGRVIARAPAGADTILYADLDLAQTGGSHARRLFLRDRRPDLYAAWIAPAREAR